MKQLAGRVAVITGAAGGIGRALAAAFAREGMDVALADIDQDRMAASAEQVRALGRRAITVRTDVRDSSSLAQLLERTLAELGSCHLMCNNAGVFHAASMLGAAEAEWRRVIDTNLWGVIHGCRVFGAHFAQQGEGHLLNTGSAAGLFAIPGMSSYSTSKFAVVGFSQQLRWELAASGVGVTVLCPGVVKTQMAKATGVGLEHLDVDEMVRRAPMPEGLAKKAVRAVRRNRALVLYGPDAVMLSFLRRLPLAWLEPLGRFLGRQGLLAVRPPALPPE